VRPDISRRHSNGRSAAGFDRFDLRPELRRAVADAGYEEPRPVQEQALPPALAGRDVLGLAQTGTGKTAAFVLPILQQLLDADRSKDRGKARRKHGPRALVVAPTRELASQVHAEFERLGVHTPHTSTAVFGGVPIVRQQRAVSRGPDVVVACPGRLLDLLGRGSLRLDRVEVLVLDEADHMFDMGFLPDVRRILRALPAKRQNLMYSATMPREIRKLADSVLVKPAVVELGHSKPAETIAHALYPLAEIDKVGALERLLAGDDFRSAIVFLRTKRRAKRLAQRLDSRGHAAVALQGNMSQPQRERALRGFREGTYDVLVATDIAARGLDIAGVSHVVNFDVPNTPDAYTHRIGRTGRSEQTGTAFTFVTNDDADALRAIEKRLGARIERRPVSELGRLERTSLKGSKGPRRQQRSGGARRGTQSKPGARKTTRLRKVKRPKKTNRSWPVPAKAGAKAGADSPRAESRPDTPPGPSFGTGVFEASA
jgi:ATP-dependent RNA helicase RhlE